MSLIPDYMRAGLLAQAEATLNDTATIERNGGGSVDDAGHAMVGWTVVDANVPARWLPRNRTAATDSVMAGQSMDKVYCRVILKLGTVVREGDRIASGGLKYPVLQIIQRPTDAFWIEVEVATPAEGLR